MRSGALVRRREVQSALVLLRLAMAYSVGGRSLRQVSAWASEAGIANLSDVAVLKRLKAAAGWISGLLARMLADRARVLTSRWPDLRIRLLDATTVSRRGSKGTDWRLHMGYDLGAQVLDHCELTDASGGETLARHPLREGEIVVADRGYAHRRGIHTAKSCGAEIVVRFNWQNVPLQTRDGDAVDMLALVRNTLPGEILDIAVQTAPAVRDGVPAIPGRLVALRKNAQAEERDRRHILAQAKKKGKTPDRRTLEAAAFVFVFTTLSEDRLSGSGVLELYRFRWQIELAFRRLKGILELDEIEARDEKLCRTFLCTKIIAALLVEELTHAYVDFSPWGYGTPSSGLLVAPVPYGL